MGEVNYKLSRSDTWSQRKLISESGARWCQNVSMSATLFYHQLHEASDSDFSRAKLLIASSWSASHIPFFAMHKHIKTSLPAQLSPEVKILHHHELFMV